MAPDRSSSRRAFGSLLLLAGLLWAVYVVIRYLGADNHFLGNFLSSFLHLHATPRKLVVLAVMFSACVLFGYGLGEDAHRNLLLGAAGAICLVLVLTVLPPLLAALQSVDSINDGQRAPLVVIVAALAGVGVGWGVHLSGRSLRFGLLVAGLLLPFLFTALRAGAIGALLALGWLFLLADSIGTVLLQRLNRSMKMPATSLERAGILPAAVGLSVLIPMMLGLGILGGADATAILLFLLLLTGLCVRQIGATLRRLAGLSWSRPVELSVFELGGLAMLAALFLIYWICTLAPEVGLDAIGFRMAAPVLWMRAGAIRPLPELLGTYSFFAAEILHLLVLPLTGWIAVKVVQFGLAFLLVAGTWVQVLGARRIGAAALYLFAFWGSTLLWWQMSWGFVDVTQLFFYFACILAVRLWLNEPDSPVWLVAAGMAGATAAVVKPNGIFALATAAMVVAWMALVRRRSLRMLLRDGLALGLPALLCLAPWLLRSLMLTGNPVFPFANGLFQSPLYPEKLIGVVGVRLSLPEILQAPWDAFFAPDRFGSFATYNPMILGLALLGISGLAWVSSRKDWLWPAAALLAGLSWLLTEQNLRYTIFVMYLLVLALSLGLLQWQDRISQRYQRTIFQALLLAGLVWGFAIQAVRPSFWLQNTYAGPAFPTKVVLSEQPLDEYAVAYLPTYFCGEWLNRHDGPNTKVWQIPPLRDNLYFEAPSIVAAASILPVAQPLTEVLGGEAGSDASIYRRLQAGGYTHLVYHLAFMPEVSSVPEAERPGIFNPAFESAYLQLECADRGLRLYRIRPDPRQAIDPAPEASDLVINSGFESLNVDGLPYGWVVRGRGVVLQSQGNTTLELNKGATLTQCIPIDDDMLYELTMDLRSTSSDSAATLEVRWLDPSGAVRLVALQALNPEEQFVSDRFLQTAPAGVETAVISISGNNTEIDNIIVRSVMPEAHTP